MKKGNYKNLHLVASQPLKEKYASQEKDRGDHVQVSHVLDNVPLGVLFSPSLASLVAQTVKNLPAMEEN